MRLSLFPGQTADSCADAPRYPEYRESRPPREIGDHPKSGFSLWSKPGHPAAIYEESLTKPGCMAMEFTGRPMRGFVLVSPEAIEKKSAFAYWVKLALEFNPRAVATKKPKRKPRKNTTRSSDQL